MYLVLIQEKQKRDISSFGYHRHFYLVLKLIFRPSVFGEFLTNFSHISYQLLSLKKQIKNTDALVEIINYSYT